MRWEPVIVDGETSIMPTRPYSVLTTTLCPDSLGGNVSPPASARTTGTLLADERQLRGAY